MNPTGMTPRQLQLMVFVQNYVAEHGYSPNYQEMADGVQLASKGNVARIVHCLEERGYVRHLPRKARSLGLTDDGAAVAQRFADRCVSRGPIAGAA